MTRVRWPSPAAPVAHLAGTGRRHDARVGRGGAPALVRRVAMLTAAVLVCSAHVGSPDAWYDGPAGPYHVLVHIQAPAVVPGIAIVNVRANEPGVEQVTAFVNKFDGTGGAPPPDVAAPVPGSPGWYRTRLWVMSAGSNSVTVGVRGGKGSGSVVIPLVAVASRRLGFGRPLAVVLIAAGLFLTLGVVSIVGAAVRESVLAPGDEPDLQRRRRARFAMARAVVVIALALTGSALWWRAADASFARTLYHPMSVSARVERSPGGSRLLLAIDDSAWIHRHEEVWLRARGLRSASELIEDHGKLVHLYLIAAGGRAALAHIHPRTADSVTFAVDLPPLPPGRYWAYGDILHASGFAETLTAEVDLPVDSEARMAGAPSAYRSRASATPPSDQSSDPDDSWALGKSGPDPRRSLLADGSTVVWLRPDSPLHESEEADLRFAVLPPSGDAGGLEPYMDMASHAAVVREDGKVFVHLHPIGTISLAAQARLMHAPAGTSMDMTHGMPTAEPMSDTLYFPYAFPKPGEYTMWVQVKRHGRVLTGSFPIRVLPAK
jgi:hypothetical protein